MILHKFTTSPFSDGKIQSCIGRMDNFDKVLLTQNAVYACQHQDLSNKLNRLAPIFCIQEDLDARGLVINNPIYKGISYQDFVQLSIDCKQVISW